LDNDARLVAMTTLAGDARGLVYNLRKMPTSEKLAELARVDEAMKPCRE
jgi:hypothetical protein